MGACGTIAAMEAECTRCHRKFQTRREGVDICPDCLSSEFCVQEVVEQSPEEAREEAQLRRQVNRSNRRQQARAESLVDNYTSAEPFRHVGGLRLVFGLVVFGIVAFAFLMGTDSAYETFLSELPPMGQHALAALFCVPASLLIFFSVRRLRWVTGALALAVLAGSWYLPLLSYRMILGDDIPEKAAASEPEARLRDDGAATKVVPRRGTRVLSTERIAALRGLFKDEPEGRYYLVYMNTPAKYDDVFCRALKRICMADAVRPYRENAGAVYLVKRAHPDCSAREMRRLLERYGVVTYDEDGVFEVNFDEEKSNLGRRPIPTSRNPNADPQFVESNLLCIMSPDADRVARAAEALAAARVTVRRDLIREKLMAVLQDAWASEPEAWGQLVRALIVYSEPGDAAVLPPVRRYFDFRLACGSRGGSADDEVVAYLVRETPATMVQPVVDFWAQDPVNRSNAIVLLGSAAEEAVLNSAGNGEDPQKLHALLNYLSLCGTERCVPLLESLLKHPDDLTRHSAEATLLRVRERLAAPDAAP